MSLLRHLAKLFGVEITLKDMEVALRMESILEKPPAMQGPIFQNLLKDHRIAADQQGRVVEQFFPDILEELQRNPKNKDRPGTLQDILDYHQRKRADSSTRISGQSFGAARSMGPALSPPPPQKMEKLSPDARQKSYPLPKNFSEDGETHFDFPEGFFTGACDAGEFYGTVIRYLMSKDHYIGHYVASEVDLKLLNDVETAIAQALLRRPAGEIESEAAAAPDKSGFMELLKKMRSRNKNET